MKEIRRGSHCNIHKYNWCYYMLVRQTKSKCPPCEKTENDGFKLKGVQFNFFYMGKVTNQDRCHTTNMKNDGNLKYFLYIHEVYQSKGTQKTY